MSVKSSPRSSRIRSVALAAMLVALFVGLPVATIAHADDHAHRFCSEHGSFEDIGDASRAPPTSEHGQLAHDACALSPTCLTKEAAAHERVAPEVAERLSSIAPVSPHEVPLPQRHPLLVAPKASPPARAV